MAGIDKKLTDLTELSNPTDNAWIHVVEPTDISQSPEGSSYKAKKININPDATVISKGKVKLAGDFDITSTADLPRIKDATTTVKGKIKLAGDFDPTSTADNPVIVYASETVPGKVELATSSETITGTDTNKAVTPAGLSDKLSSFSSGVLTTNTNITSSNLTTQDVSGFVAYINGLVSSFSVEANEIRTYTVTDTGQKFEILLRGRSFGGSEPDILTNDVLEVDREYLKFNESFPAHYYSLSNGNQSYVNQFSSIVTDGTTGFTSTSSNYANSRRLANSVTSSAAAGSTSQIRTGFPAGSISISNPIIEVFNAIENASVLSTIRTFSGIRIVTGQVSGIGNIEPSTQTSVVGVGNDSTDSNLQIMHNDTTGTCTKIDLGASFPAKYSVNQNAYRILMHNPLGTTNWIVMVENIRTGAKISKTITNDVPASGQIYPITWANNESTATAVAMTSFGWQVKNN